MQQQKLDEYSLLQVNGNDATQFLQGQLTCDVSKLTDDNSSLGAHCNAKGRMLSLFRIFKQTDKYYLLMPSDVVEAAQQSLQKYAIFSKVTLAIVTLSTVETLPFNVDPNSIQKTNVEQGIARLYPQTIGEFLPHYINLPKLGGVDFDKGCYTGQEIIARMQHRGKLKQHLYQLRLTDYYQPGDKVIHHEQKLGTCVDITKLETNDYLLLVIMKDEVAKQAPLWRP